MNAWEALQSHHRKISTPHLRSFLQKIQSAASGWQRKLQGLYLDYTQG